jgi:hypothetical protein
MQSLSGLSILTIVDISERLFLLVIHFQGGFMFVLLKILIKFNRKKWNVMYCYENHSLIIRSKKQGVKKNEIITGSFKTLREALNHAKIMSQQHGCDVTGVYPKVS